MEAEKILFIAQEINPYVPESNLTRMGRDIPLDALERNREIRAFMPKWGNINERRNQLHEVIRLSGMNIIVNDNDHQLIIKVASIMGTRMQVYFIDNEDYFAKRLAEQDKEGNEYQDNVERAAFYARGVLETVKKLRWVPDVIHCQGWISALVPVYLKTAYADEPCFRDCRVVFSLTDHKLTLPTGDNFAQILEYRNADASCFKEFGTSLKIDDLIKLAIKYSDGVTFETKRKPKKAITDYATACDKLIMEKRNGSPADFMDFFDAVWSRNRQVPIED
ncbi:MAG: glycogen/starch synthase [Bacteroidaceae bacterium]|nr:glycogen/starch synthase [Bacteroidaceae bacterium]